MDSSERDQLIRIYLNDHLTGATAGVDLARRAAGSAPAAISTDLSRLADEIAEDREALLGIMERLGVPVQRLKAYAGWVAEKVGRLKLNGRLTKRSPLSTVLELEGLRMAVQGKQAGWEALRAERSGRLDRAQLDALVDRAGNQLATLAELHAAATASVFGATAIHHAPTTTE